MVKRTWTGLYIDPARQSTIRFKDKTFIFLIIQPRVKAYAGVEV